MVLCQSFFKKTVCYLKLCYFHKFVIFFPQGRDYETDEESELMNEKEELSFEK